MVNCYNIKIFLVLFAICLVGTNVLAFAVSAPYSKDNPLKMQAGEIREVSFTMQNLIGNEDMNVIVSLLEGKEIAEITSGERYTIPLRTANTKVILRISIPSDANAGDSYDVKFSVQSSPEGREGNIQLGVGYNVDFPVIVLEKPAPTPSPTPIPQAVEEPEAKSNINIVIVIIVAIIIVAIIIVIGLIIWFVKRKKQFK